MREERKLKKAIRKNGIETQSDTLDELKRRYPQYAKQPEITVKRRKIVGAALATAAACAVIVPCAVLLPGNVNNNTSEPTFAQTEKCYPVYIGCTLGEYSEAHGGEILYFDWYDEAIDINTHAYNYYPNSDEPIYFEENAYFPERDEIVVLLAIEEGEFLDMFAWRIESCRDEQTVKDHVVKYTINDTGAYSILDHGGYRYYIEVVDGTDANRLFELNAILLGE